MSKKFNPLLETVWASGCVTTVTFTWLRKSIWLPSYHDSIVLLYCCISMYVFLALDIWKPWYEIGPSHQCKKSKNYSNCIILSTSYSHFGKILSESCSFSSFTDDSQTMITMNSNLCQTQTIAHTLLRNVLNHRCQRECFGCFFLTKKGRTTSVWKNKSHHKCWGEYMASVNCSNRCLVIALCALLADNCRFRAESAEITCNFSFPKRSDIV